MFEEIATMDFPFEGIPTVPPRKDMDHMAFFCGACRHGPACFLCCPYGLLPCRAHEQACIGLLVCPTVAVPLEMLDVQLQPQPQGEGGALLAGAQPALTVPTPLCQCHQNSSSTRLGQSLGWGRPNPIAAARAVQVPSDGLPRLARGAGQTGAV